MIEFFANYGLFLLKAITIVFAVIAIIVAAAVVSRKTGVHEGLEVENLNEKYQQLAMVLKHAVFSKRLSRQKRKPKRLE